jgi:hypothetical protein
MFRWRYWYNTRGYLADHGQPQSLAPVISYDLANRPGGRPLYPYQHDVAPRFAIAYAPDSKSSIRAGFGMFYDLFGQGLIRSADATSLGFSTSLQNAANAQSATVPASQVTATSILQFCPQPRRADFRRRNQTFSRSRTVLMTNSKRLTP